MPKAEHKKGSALHIFCNIKVLINKDAPEERVDGYFDYIYSVLKSLLPTLVCDTDVPGVRQLLLKTSIGCFHPIIVPYEPTADTLFAYDFSLKALSGTSGDQFLYRIDEQTLFEVIDEVLTKLTSEPDSPYADVIFGQLRLC